MLCGFGVSELDTERLKPRFVLALCAHPVLCGGCRKLGPQNGLGRPLVGLEATKMGQPDSSPAGKIGGPLRALAGYLAEGLAGG